VEDAIQALLFRAIVLKLVPYPSSVTREHGHHGLWTSSKAAAKDNQEEQVRRLKFTVQESAFLIPWNGIYYVYSTCTAVNPLSPTEFLA